MGSEFNVSGNWGTSNSEKIDQWKKAGVISSIDPDVTNSAQVKVNMILPKDEMDAADIEDIGKTLEDLIVVDSTLEEYIIGSINKGDNLIGLPVKPFQETASSSPLSKLNGKIVGMGQKSNADEEDFFRVLFPDGTIEPISTSQIGSRLVAEVGEGGEAGGGGGGADAMVLPPTGLIQPAKRESDSSSLGLWNSTPTDLLNFNITSIKLLRMNEMLSELNDDKSWGIFEEGAQEGAEEMKGAEEREDIKVQIPIETIKDLCNTLIANLRNLYNELLLPLVTTRIDYFKSLVSLDASKKGETSADSTDTDSLIEASIRNALQDALKNDEGEYLMLPEEMQDILNRLMSADPETEATAASQADAEMENAISSEAVNQQKTYVNAAAKVTTEAKPEDKEKIDEQLKEETLMIELSALETKGEDLKKTAVDKAKSAEKDMLEQVVATEPTRQQELSEKSREAYLAYMISRQYQMKMTEMEQKMRAEATAKQPSSSGAAAAEEEKSEAAIKPLETIKTEVETITDENLEENQGLPGELEKSIIWIKSKKTMKPPELKTKLKDIYDAAGTRFEDVDNLETQTLLQEIQRVVLRYEPTIGEDEEEEDEEEEDTAADTSAKLKNIAVMSPATPEKKSKSYLPEEAKDIVNRLSKSIARGGLTALGLVVGEGNLSPMGCYLIRTYITFSQLANKLNSDVKSPAISPKRKGEKEARAKQKLDDKTLLGISPPSSPPPDHIRISPVANKVPITSHKLVEILTGLQLYVLYKFGWDYTKMWVSLSKHPQPVSLTSSTIESMLLGINQLDEKLLTGTLDILGAARIIPNEQVQVLSNKAVDEWQTVEGKTSVDLGIYGWNGNNIRNMQNLFAVMQNAIPLTTYEQGESEYVPYMCTRPPNDVVEKTNRNSINNSAPLPAFLEQTVNLAQKTGIPIQKQPAITPWKNAPSMWQMGWVMCGDESIEDNMKQCNFGPACVARARYIQKQKYKLSAVKSKEGEVKQISSDVQATLGPIEANIADLQNRLVATHVEDIGPLDQQTTALVHSLQTQLHDEQVKQHEVVSHATTAPPCGDEEIENLSYEGESIPFITSNTGVFEYEKIKIKIKLGVNNEYEVKKTISLKTGADMQANYVYKGMLGQLGVIFDTEYKNSPGPRKKKWNLKSYDMAWEKINDNNGSGGLFAELYQIGMVKGGGDINQEVSASWACGGNISNNEPDNETWYPSDIKGIWEKQKIPNREPNIPKYKTPDDNPCPDAYRWGFMGDRPSGWRPALWNLCSNMGALVGKYNKTNRLNISGYLGSAEKKPTSGGGGGGNSYEIPDPATTFFVANLALLKAIEYAKSSSDNLLPAFLSREALDEGDDAAKWRKYNLYPVDGSRFPSEAFIGGGKKKHKLTRKHKRFPKRTKQRKIKRRKESLKKLQETN